MKQRWYTLQPEEIIKKLNSNLEKGLTNKEAKKRIKVYGKNTIEKKFEIKPVKIYLRQFKDLIIIILLFSTLISIVIGKSGNSILLIVFILVLTAMGFFQEYKAEKSIQELKKITTDTAIVVRGRKEIEIDTKDLVPGDIILLNTGDIIPADGRIFDSLNLEIDESSLTGESKPVKKNSKRIIGKAPLSHQSNMAFTGTTVVSGRGKAIIVGTGLNTELGKIASFIEMEEQKTPLRLQLDILNKQIFIVVVFSCILILIVSLIQGQKTRDVFFNIFALAISAIPEALPITLTVILAIGIKRMAKKNAVVKRLAGVETLGNVDVICSDKTGTLTKNEMTVRKIYTDKIIEVTGVGYIPKGGFFVKGKRIEPLKDTRLKLLLKAGLMCNTAKLNSLLGKYWIVGSPTEGALIVAVRKAGLKEVRNEKNIVLDLPFTSERKIMITAFKEENQIFVYSKGAPEILLEKCEYIYPKSRLTKNRKLEISENFRKMESKGLRILAIAYKTAKNVNRKTLDTELIFLGLVGMVDPPRGEVKKTVRLCEEVGIDLKIVTGDSLLTTKYVAEEVGLKIKKVLTGEELDKLTDEELEKIIEEITIFARTTPEHKFRIVNLLKKKGHRIAVTGDGINDAPALKTADIGIAMGIKGTDVARETSDIVLLDDNLKTIFAAVEEGRRVYENIRNSVVYLLSTSVSEIILILTSIMSNIPFIFTAVQIFWINIVTEGIPAIGLAFETGEKDLLKRKIRDPKEGILTPKLLHRIIGLGALMGIIPFILLMYNYHKGFDIARTVAFNTLIFFEFFNILNCRSLNKTNYKLGFTSNRILIFLVLISFSFQFLLMNSEFFLGFFNLVKLDLTYQLFMIAIASSILLLGEIKKSGDKFKWLPF